VEFVEMSAADRDRLDAFIASQIAPE